MLFHPLNSLPASDRALIDAHIATYGVTDCPPCTYSMSDEASEMMIEARRVSEARRRAVAITNGKRSAEAEARRRQMIPLFKAGHSPEAVAERFGISASHALATRKRLKREGKL